MLLGGLGPQAREALLAEGTRIDAKVVSQRHSEGRPILQDGALVPPGSVEEHRAGAGSVTIRLEVVRALHDERLHEARIG